MSPARQCSLTSFPRHRSEELVCVQRDTEQKSEACCEEAIETLTEFLMGSWKGCLHGRMFQFSQRQIFSFEIREFASKVHRKQRSKLCKLSPLLLEPVYSFSRLFCAC